MQAGQDDLHHEEHPPYLANLGLLSEPFADTPSGHFFYVGADGEQRLDLMHHLAPYSPLLVIMGEQGIGKTALLQQFVARAKDNWRTFVVTARDDMDRDDFMAALSESLGLPLQSQVDPQAQYLAVIAQLRALRQTAQVPILLIDDAQKLSVSLLELIHKFCEENDNGHILSVILFGTPRLQTLWNQQTLMPLAARVTHTFEVTPYTEEETARYIRHRLRAAGASDDGPFDSVTLNKIHAASGGIPARINALAQEVLVNRTMAIKQSQAKDSHSGGATGGRPRRWALLVAGVVVVVLLVAGPLRSVLFKSPPLPPSEPQQARSLPLPTPAPTTDDGKEERVIRSEGSDTPPAAPLASSPSDEEAPSSTSSIPEVVKTIPLPPEDTTTVTGPALVETPAPAPEKSRPPAAAVPASPPQVGAAGAKPAAPAPSKASENKALVSPVEHGHGADWLKAQAEDNYTLQLMAIKEEAMARQFIETHHLQGKAAYFPVMSGGQTLYAVVYGSFPQRSEAVRAAKGLPKAWGTPNPWIRSLKSLPALNP